MPANFRADEVRPGDGGGAKFQTTLHVSDASPVALSFIDALFGPGIENPLSPARREEFLHRFDSASQAELISLLREVDPELFHRGVLRFAGVQESRGQVTNAALLYRSLSQRADGDTLALARRRLAVLHGSGEMGERAEFLVSHFIREASDPAPLLAMGAAGLAFRTARSLTLGRLLAAPSGALTRGIGARSLAGTLGFGAEVLAFSAGTRALHSALGKELDWSSGALRAELSQSLLFLGAIKAFGLAGRHLQRSASKSPASGLALQHASLLGGIYVGQALEEVAGFRGPRDTPTAMLDSLAMFLSFHVAGRLSRTLLGTRFTSWERELDLRSAELVQSAGSMPGFRLAMATVNGAGGAGLFSSGNHAAKTVFMASGSPRGNWPGAPRPTSTFPPRSSDFFPSKNSPGIVKVNPPPAHIDEILDLLLPHRSIDPEALPKAARKLDWLMPDERSELLRWALESTSPESLAERLAAMATQPANRSSAVHALRLLLTMQAGDRRLSPRLMTATLERIGTVVSPDPEKTASLRWKVAESRFLHALDAVVSSEAEGRRKNLVFEMELARLARGGFSARFFDDLLYFSLDLRNPKSRHLLASSAVSMALGTSEGQGPMRDFMNGYYIVGRLAETGNLAQAGAAAQLVSLRSQNWGETNFPKQYQDFLRRRLEFQQKVVKQYSDILKDAQPNTMQAYYQVQAAFGHRHLPEAWGVIWTLREHASLLNTQKGELTMSAMIRLQAAQNLMRDMVLDPLISKALHASPELVAPRQRLLDLAEDLPARARIESQEPLQVIFNALAARQEWNEAYRLLDAIYHLQIADPMLLRTVHASLLMGLDVVRHRAADTPEYEALSVQMKRFSDFESRFF